MASSHQPNYLRAHRKRLALSQEDITCLLGAASAAKVSSYEHFKSAPSLKALLAFEIIFQTPARELFRHTFAEVEKEVVKRARKLVRKAVKGKPGKQTARKCHVLAAIASPVEIKNP